jgi:hypothetical protein
MISQMLYGNDNNQFRGLKNSAGTDFRDLIGALTPTLTGLGIVDHYEALRYVFNNTLPVFVSEEEEAQYVFLMNRRTRGKIKQVLDLNGKPKFDGKQIEEVDVLNVPQVANDEYFLTIPNWWTLITTSGGILNLNDGGIVRLKEGIITMVSRTYADFSYNYGFKRKVGSSTPNDNTDQNAHRVASLLSSYT